MSPCPATFMPSSAESRDEKPAPAPDLRSLTLAIRRGEAEAFSRFYDLYSFRLYKLLLVMARGDELAAREVGQAIWIKLAKGLKVFNDEKQLWAWLNALARNAFIDYCRAHQRHSRVLSLEEMAPEIGIEPPDEQRLSEMLREALAALPPEEQELLQAAYIDERPLQTLADESGQTYKAIESRLGRLRLKVKEQLLKHLRRERES